MFMNQLKTGKRLEFGSQILLAIGLSVSILLSSASTSLAAGFGAFTNGWISSQANAGNFNQVIVTDTKQLIDQVGQFYESSQASASFNEQGLSGNAFTSASGLGDARIADLSASSATSSSAIGFASSASGSQLYLRFEDTITITSSTLAQGTSVQFDFSAYLNSTLQQGSALGQFFVSDEFNTQNIAVLPNLFSEGSNGTQIFSTQLFSSGIGTVSVGQTLILNGYLTVANNSNDNGPNPSAASFATARATFGFRLLTPGATYTSASGTSYSGIATEAPVPELPPLPVPEPSDLEGLLVFASLGSFALKNRKCIKP
jgi:hypothetical protein